jgi:hypothetical protein
MAERIPVHNPGTISLLPYTTIATFSPYSFLENIAVRSNGTLLVSNMTSGEIYYLDPHAANPQSTVQTIHSFNSSKPLKAGDSSQYGSGYVAEALVENPGIPDVFYTMSGKHRARGSWAIWRLDMRDFDPASAKVEVEKVADVPDAQWLNGATFLPVHNVLLMAESLQGKLIACHFTTGEVGTWLEDQLLGKMTGRQSWPGVNGVQFFHGRVFMTSSDRGLVLRVAVDNNTGRCVEGSLEVVAEGFTGDDLAFDVRGSMYVATNPAQTVMKLDGIGFKENAGDKKGELERTTILGGEEKEETAGPTAVAFGRGEEDREALYVVTTGGIINPVNGKVELARVVRVDVAVKGW